AATPFAVAKGLAPIRWRQERTQSRKAVGMHKPEHHQLGEPIFDLRPQHTGRVDDLVEEARAMLLQMLGQLLSARADRRGFHRRLEALELRDQRGQRVGTLAPLARNDVLPAAEEAHEILAGDRLDLLPQTLDGVTMNAREERAVAPLGLRLRRA